MIPRRHAQLLTVRVGLPLPYSWPRGGQHMTVAELIERLQEQPQYLEVVIPDPDPHIERATHQPCDVVSVLAARGHGGVGGWDLDGAHGRTLAWRPDDEPVTVVVLGTEDGD